MTTMRRASLITGGRWKRFRCGVTPRRYASSRRRAGGGSPAFFQSRSARPADRGRSRQCPTRRGRHCPHRRAARARLRPRPRRAAGRARTPDRSAAAAIEILGLAVARRGDHRPEGRQDGVRPRYPGASRSQSCSKRGSRPPPGVPRRTRSSGLLWRPASTSASSWPATVRGWSNGTSPASGRRLARRGCRVDAAVLRENGYGEAPRTGR
jgi:hypothetical protein